MTNKLVYSIFSLLFFSCSILNAIWSDTKTKSGCMACEEIKSLRMPDVRITAADIVNEDVSFCKVLGVIGTEINFELLLPEEWNERFVMGGGGGYVGSIQNQARYKVKEGYATSGTDTGHQGIGIKADWALYNMERLVNFGHLAVHRTALVSKHIIYKYYCSDPQYSYFVGCSRGGGQAMIEAQRYPDDFDGIVAAAPILSWTATSAEMIQNIQAIWPDPSKLNKSAISPAQLATLQEAVLEACDDLDGVKDQIINDPRDCNFDLSSLPECTSDTLEENCFTSKDIEVLRTIYDGPVIENRKIYPGYPFGCENEQAAMPLWITGPSPALMALNFPSAHFGFGTETMKYFIFQNPDWDYSTYDFHNFLEDTWPASAVLDATDTDYSTFKENGSKLIIWHGWNDYALSAYTTIDHFETVLHQDPEIKDYMRLFLLPGVLHCGDGPGPSEADWLEILMEWVENGITPERIVVSKTKADGTVMTRPVFPFPRKAMYDGKGDPNDEKSFN